MRFEMAREKKDRERRGGGERDEIPQALDEVVSELFRSGTMRTSEPARVPAAPEADPARIEASRKETRRAGYRVLLRSKRHAVQGLWFGQWLRAIRTGARLREEEVASAISMDPVTWKKLEDAPLQVTALNEELVYSIVDLFSMSYRAAETSMRASLTAPPTMGGRVFARTNEPGIAAEWTREFRGEAGPNVPPGAQAKVEALLASLRAKLEERKRNDLLEDSF